MKNDILLIARCFGSCARVIRSLDSQVPCHQCPPQSEQLRRMLFRATVRVGDYTLKWIPFGRLDDKGVGADKVMTTDALNQRQRHINDLGVAEALSGSSKSFVSQRA